MTTLDYEKLFEPYTKDGHRIGRTLEWVKSEAAKRRLLPGVAEAAIEAVFEELASGMAYPTDYCPCGCGIDKAGTAIEHSILKRAIELDNEGKNAAMKRFEEIHNARLKAFVNEARKAKKSKIAEYSKYGWLGRMPKE